MQKCRSVAYKPKSSNFRLSINSAVISTQPEASGKWKNVQYPWRSQIVHVLWWARPWISCQSPVDNFQSHLPHFAWSKSAPPHTCSVPEMSLSEDMRTAVCHDGMLCTTVIRTQTYTSLSVVLAGELGAVCFALGFESFCFRFFALRPVCLC